MLKWIAGIVATIVGGIAVWYLTEYLNRPPPLPPPTPPLTFLEKLQGQYSLRSWTQANKPIVMGVSVDTGTLTINRSGDADWEMVIWDSAKYPQGPPGDNRSRIKCGGLVSSSPQELRWVSGGQRNVAIDWARGIESVRDMVWPALCGGHVTGQSASFALNYEQPSTGPARLEMTNSEGVFIWEKK